MLLIRAILVKTPAIPITGPLIYFSRPDSFQAPFRTRCHVESPGVGYLRMINPRNLPEAPTRLSVAFRSRIERRFVLYDPQRQPRIDSMFHSLRPDIGLHLRCGWPVALRDSQIGGNAGEARTLRPMVLSNGHLRGQKKPLRASRKNNLGARICPVEEKRNQRQGVERERE